MRVEQVDVTVTIDPTVNATTATAELPRGAGGMFAAIRVNMPATVEAALAGPSLYIIDQDSTYIYEYGPILINTHNWYPSEPNLVEAGLAPYWRGIDRVPVCGQSGQWSVKVIADAEQSESREIACRLLFFTGED